MSANTVATVSVTICAVLAVYMAANVLLNERESAHEPDIRCINGDLMTSRRVVVDGPDMLQGMLTVCQKRETK